MHRQHRGPGHSWRLPSGTVRSDSRSSVPHPAAGCLEVPAKPSAPLNALRPRCSSSAAISASFGLSASMASSSSSSERTLLSPTRATSSGSLSPSSSARLVALQAAPGCSALPCCCSSIPLPTSAATAHASVASANGAAMPAAAVPVAAAGAVPAAPFASASACLGAVARCFGPFCLLPGHALHPGSRGPRVSAPAGFVVQLSPVQPSADLLKSSRATIG